MSFLVDVAVGGAIWYGSMSSNVIDSYPDGRMNASEMKVCENERN